MQTHIASAPEIVKLNLEGEICPYTLTRALRKAKKIKNELESGKKILEVIYDHPPAADNVPTEFQKQGLRAKIEKIGNARWKITIQK